MIFKSELSKFYISLRKGEFRVNYHHAKTVLILMCIASFAFIVIQDSRGSFFLFLKAWLLYVKKVAKKSACDVIKMREMREVGKKTPTKVMDNPSFL